MIVTVVEMNHSKLRIHIRSGKGVEIDGNDDEE